MIGVHAENPDQIDQRTEEFLAEGKTSAWYHYMSRPEFVEAEAVKRAIHWAKSFDAPLYIVHLACKDGLDEVTRARDEGYEIYAETCPHYLHLPPMYINVKMEEILSAPHRSKEKKVKMRFGKASSAVTLQRLLPITVLSNPMRKIGAKTILQRFQTAAWA